MRVAMAVSEYLIWRACQRLPRPLAAERLREWIAELPAIVEDPDTPLRIVRMAAALLFAADQHRTVRRYEYAIRYSLGDASKDLILIGRILRYMIVFLGISIGSSILGAIAIDFLGGIACVVGVSINQMSGPDTLWVVAISAAVGGAVGLVVGVLVAARSTAEDIRKRWRAWYIAGMGASGQ